MTAFQYGDALSDIGEHWTENYLRIVFQRTVESEPYLVLPEAKRSFGLPIASLLK